MRLDDTPGAPAYELFELADLLFWAARWATDTLLGTHEGGPILPPEPLTGYHVEISEEETDAIKR